MRKKAVAFIIIVFLLGTIVGATETYSKKITAWFYDIDISLDGSPLSFSHKPFIYNGQVYVPINELSQNIGYRVQWNDNTKTMSLNSHGNNTFALNTLQYQLDQKNLEVQNLKYQLSQKDAELAVLRDDYNYDDSDTSDILDDLEELFEDDYNRYYYSGTSLYFEYTVTQLSNDDIRVRMYGDFDRTHSDWRNRNKTNFRDFILEICDEVDKEFNEDVIVVLFDDERDQVAEYEYSDSRNRIIDYDEY